MFKVEAHLWKTSDGRLVPTGDPDAAFLAFPAGTELAHTEAERWGLVKAVAKPHDKAVTPERNKGAEADLEALRGEAQDLGVKVDKRWAADRLRDEIAKAEKVEE